MKIKYLNYLITPNDGSPDRFDLSKIVQKTRKAKEDKEEEIYEGTNDMGYSMRLSSCIERIIEEETVKKYNKDEIIELKDYIEEYKRQKEEVINHIESLTTIKFK
jgi:hypothetical protein